MQCKYDLHFNKEETEAQRSETHLNLDSWPMYPSAFNLEFATLGPVSYFKKVLKQQLNEARPGMDFPSSLQVPHLPLVGRGLGVLLMHPCILYGYEEQ